MDIGHHDSQVAHRSLVASVAFAVTTSRYFCAEVGIDACGGTFDGTALVRGVATYGLPNGSRDC
jgi:hypothetical protein